jgi:glycosyltransferase involved in cell wall biosynthesis
MFIITSMPVGGQETLLVDLIRGLDRRRCLPELCCLKEFGPLGEVLAAEIPAFSGLIGSKVDLRVFPRLVRLLRLRGIDAVVTVGAGDKMFWGRLAAKRAGVPVVLSALHTTGWPDGVGRLNRWLTPLTDGFLAVAQSHADYLVQTYGFPERKVFVIPNGVDTDRFRPARPSASLLESLGLAPQTPVVGIVAALRPEKNHALFLQAARLVRERVPGTVFLIVGDGPCRPALERLARQLGITGAVRFLGTRDDIDRILGLMNVFALTSDNEANPVSILEAMSSGLAVVATDVGSVAESVADGRTGFLSEPGDADQVAGAIARLLTQPELAKAMGRTGRRHVEQFASCRQMVEQYERLIEAIYAAKCGGEAWPESRPAAVPRDTPDEAKSPDRAPEAAVPPVTAAPWTPDSRPARL